MKSAYPETSLKGAAHFPATGPGPTAWPGAQTPRLAISPGNPGVPGARAENPMNNPGPPLAAAAEESRTPAPVKSVPNLPPILLERDEPPLQPISPEPVEPEAAISHSAPEPTELPGSYGTGKLLLFPRDPHWLYAHWDLTPEQLDYYNALSGSHHLFLRIHAEPKSKPPLAEIALQDRTNFRFVHVEQADANYVGQLGYYRPGGEWIAITTSTPAATPPDSPSTHRAVQFVSFRGDLPLPVWEAGESPNPIPGQLGLECPTEDLAQLELPISGPGVSLTRFRQALPSSPFGSEQLPGGFWFDLGAEVVIYGATQPGARVAIAGYPIQLHLDGTFSQRLALPDGDYELMVTAVSPTDEFRAARLRFSRQTQY